MKQSPIFAKTYDLLLWLMPRTLKFPREQRFVLAKAVQETALRFQERLIEAGAARGRAQQDGPGPRRRGTDQAALLPAPVQGSGLLKLNQYRHVAEMVAEVGRLLGGWRKTDGNINVTTLSDVNPIA